MQSNYSVSPAMQSGSTVERENSANQTVSPGVDKKTFQPSLTKTEAKSDSKQSRSVFTSAPSPVSVVLRDTHGDITNLASLSSDETQSIPSTVRLFHVHKKI